MIRVLILILSLSGCTTLEKVISIPTIEVQKTNEYIVTQDKLKIVPIQDNDPEVIELEEETTERKVNAILIFFIFILLSAGITTLSLKEFNVKEKTDDGS